MGGGGGGEGDKEQGHKPPKVSASSDERTNSIVVSAAPETLKVVEGIIKDLDANPASEQAVFIYRLKNAQSRNLEGVLNSLFGTGGSSASRPSTPDQPARQSRHRIGRVANQFGRRRAAPDSAPRRTPTRPQIHRSNAGRNTGFNQGTSSATTAGGNSAIASDLTGQVYIVADNDSNSLMVLTPQKNFDRVKSVIGDLDKPVRQVVIKVLIAEVTHEKTRDVGTDSSILTNGALSRAC